MELLGADAEYMYQRNLSTSSEPYANHHHGHTRQPPSPPSPPKIYRDCAYAQLKDCTSSSTSNSVHCNPESDDVRAPLVWVPRDTQDPDSECIDKHCNQVRNDTKRVHVANGNLMKSTLSIRHVTYTVKETIGKWWKCHCRKTRQKEVLKNISMHLKSGEVTAILGNSGSGKTSLLDVIACRSHGAFSGDVMFNKVACSHDVIRQHAAYVQQADRLLANLTVRETLRYTARLKLPRGTSDQQLEEKVTSVIMEMGLKDVANSRIGDGLIRGISGGEMRRVTIAIQLFKDPELVLLDEPTSGLDSYTARYLVSNLRDLARRGKIVLLTIHQPSSDLFKFFDQIALMSVGEMVYCGPSSNLVQYFTNLGYPCDRYTNPLDRYVDIASIDRRDKASEKESIERVKKLVREFRSSVHNKNTDRAIENEQFTADIKIEQSQGPNNPTILLTILSRMNRNLLRSRKDFVSRVVLLPLSICSTLVLLGRLKHGQSSLQDRVGALYNSCSVPVYLGLIISLPLFPSLRDLYYREAVDGLYGPALFLTAYTLHVLPFHIVSSILFSSLLYWVCGLQPDVTRFLYHVLTSLLIHYWGELVSVVCMAAVLNASLANNVALLVIVLDCTVGSGLVKDLQTMPQPFQWLSYLTIFKYGAEIYVAGEFTGLTFTDCPANNQTAACFHSGDQYIDRSFPGASENIGANFGFMGAHVVGTFILALIIFKLIGPRILH